jgi:drug/metabolite transporter (DMT)-like permease
VRAVSGSYGGARGKDVPRDLRLYPLAPMRRPPAAELALFGMTIVWGLSFVTIKWALEGCGVLWLTVARNVVGLAFLLALKPSALRATALEWKAGLFAGALLAGGYLLETAGMVEAGAGKSGFLAQFYVALVPFVQAAVFRRRPAWIDVGSLALATTGIAVMVVQPGHDVSAGELLVALAACAWAVQIVVVGRVAQRVDPVRIAVIQTACIVVVAAVGLVSVGEPAPAWRGALVANVVYLGVLCSAAGFLVQAWAQRRVSPTRTAVLFCGQPVFTLAFGAWLAQERYGVRDVVGAAIIMAAVVLAVFGAKNGGPSPTGGDSLPA